MEQVTDSPEFLNLPMYEEFILDLINNNYSARTVTNYKRDLEVFASFFEYQNKKFKDLNKLMVSKYKEYLRSGKYLEFIKKLRKQADPSENSSQAGDKQKSSSNASRRDSMYTGRLSSQSVNRMLSAIRTYLRFLNDADYDLPISADAIKLIKSEKKSKQVADLDELISLIEAPETFETKRKVKLRNRAMLELLFSTGMRISELINLNREDLRLDKSGRKLKDDKIYVMGKGKKQRFVYLTPRSMHHLESYLATRKDDFPALFIPYRGLRSGTKDPYIVRLSTNYLQAKIKEYRVKLGINLPTSAHSLRHGFATYLAENGANPAAIQKLLGHESLQTTSKYVHSSDRFAQRVHKQHHPLKKDS